MHARVLAPLLPLRLKPAQTFPQLRLCAGQHKRITRQRQCRVPLDTFDAASARFAQRELMPGQIVEVRRENAQLLALGFYEPQLQRVDVFELTSYLSGGGSRRSGNIARSDGSHLDMDTLLDDSGDDDDGGGSLALPLISEEYFVARLDGAWARRRRILHPTRTNAYRIANGYADGLPSLFIDIFSASAVRVLATSCGAERLVPAVVEYLRRCGAEELLLDTPALGASQRVVLSPMSSFYAAGAPTASLSSALPPAPHVYVEGGVRYLWPRRKTPLTTRERGDVLLNTAHRRARFMLRDLSRGKRVLCVHDRSGGATMNAVMTATHVTVVEPDAATLDWMRDNLVDNHGEGVLETCELRHTPLSALSSSSSSSSRAMDVVYLEHRAGVLSTAAQWQQALSLLMQRGLVASGTIVMLAQETAPFGVEDLLPASQQQQQQQQAQDNVEECAATREALARAFRSSADAHGLRAHFLRTFAASCDYPVLPLQPAPCFAQVFFVDDGSNSSDSTSSSSSC